MKNKVAINCLLALAACSLPVTVHGQTPEPAVPSNFGPAKTVFLGYGGAPSSTFSASGRHASSEIYGAAAQAITATGKWTLVPSPASADLCMSISVESANLGDKNSASNARLAIYDCRSQALLWTLEEGIADIPFVPASRSIPKAISKFTAELNTLASGKLP